MELGREAREAAMAEAKLGTPSTRNVSFLSHTWSSFFVKVSVADPDNFYTDPNLTLHFDTRTDSDLTVLYEVQKLLCICTNS